MSYDKFLALAGLIIIGVLCWPLLVVLVSIAVYAAWKEAKKMERWNE